MILRKDKLWSDFGVFMQVMSVISATWVPWNICRFRLLAKLFRYFLYRFAEYVKILLSYMSLLFKEKLETFLGALLAYVVVTFMVLSPSKHIFLDDWIFALPFGINAFLILIATLGYSTALTTALIMVESMWALMDRFALYFASASIVQHTSQNAAVIIISQLALL